MTASAQAAEALEACLEYRVSPSFKLNVSFAVPAGITVLFGPSGAGKSTLLDLIAGLRRPDRGRIAVGGRVLFDSKTGMNLAVQERTIGYVLQSLALFPHMSVAENVAYGLRGLPAAERRRRAEALLEAFGVAHLSHQSPARISGGERQRVALARSLVIEPHALLLDEPLTALDAGTKSRIIADLRAWNNARRIPILYVTHARDEIFALGERVVAMQAGRILAQGTPRELLEAPRHELLAQMAGFENIFSAAVIARHHDTGTMTCRVGSAGLSLEVPLGPEAAGDTVRIGIRAGDILLANHSPEGLSARNVWSGRLLRLEHRDVTVIAEVEVDGGLPLQVHLTPGAERALGLVAGASVWLVIKTYSCHLLGPE